MKRLLLKNNISSILLEANKPIGNVVIAHGMMEHMERYLPFAETLVNNGYNVILFDQIGHGKSAKKLGHWENGDFINSINNYKIVIDYIKEKYPRLKTFLFAHSMGSFIAQEFIINNSNMIDGLVLSGSNGPLASVKAGAVLTRLFKSNDKPNEFLNDLMFKPYTKIFKPKRTNFDWLTSLNDEVDKYVSDPYCGFTCTTGLFKEFISSISRLNEGNKLTLIRKDLPVLLISGNDDPVGDMGKGISKLSRLYLKNGLKSVNLLLYPKARHELLNEFCKEKVIEDVMNWLENRGDSND
jgi:alpha-beta hydrolase superfamily lysophospholipase